MKNCAGCGSWIPDDARACPACGGAAGAAPIEPAEVIPPATPPPPLPPAPDDEALAAFIRRRTEGRIRTLGLLQILFGGLQLGMVALMVFRYTTGEYGRAIDELRGQFGGMSDGVDRLFEVVSSPGYLLLSHFLPFALGAALVWSGFMLRRLQGRRTGVAVGVALLLTSFFGSCCCCLGFALGIWTLVLLTSGEAKAVMDGGRT